MALGLPRQAPTTADYFLTAIDSTSADRNRFWNLLLYAKLTNHAITVTYTFADQNSCKITDFSLTPG